MHLAFTFILRGKREDRDDFPQISPPSNVLFSFSVCICKRYAGMTSLVQSALSGPTPGSFAHSYFALESLGLSVLSAMYQVVVPAVVVNYSSACLIL